jgi:hypothetical protein
MLILSCVTYIRLSLNVRCLLVEPNQTECLLTRPATEDVLDGMLSDPVWLRPKLSALFPLHPATCGTAAHSWWSVLVPLAVNTSYSDSERHGAPPALCLSVTPPWGG